MTRSTSEDDRAGGFLMRPIGVIHTPFHEQRGTPIQPAFAAGAEGTIEIAPELEEGLADLEGFSHVILLYVLDRSEGYALKVTPYLDDAQRGLFATRAPRRPNPIGLSTVRLLGIEGRSLRIADVDMLDGTPLLDIKPFVPDFDHRHDVRVGWYGERTRQDGGRADARFERGER